MKRLFSFLSGVLTGALVGATIAVLLAPSSGEQLRSSLAERLQLLREDVVQAAKTRRAELERKLAELRAPQELE